MNKLNRGFSQLREDELDNRAQSIITALTGNAAFPTPSPTLGAVQGKLDDYGAALAMTTSAGKTAQVDATRVALEQTLQMLAANLEMTPGVTDAQLATTGFDMRRPATRTGAPVEAPGNVRLKATGTSGEVKALFDAVDRARVYEVQYSLDPNAGPWTGAGSFGSTRGVVIPGLQRGKDYWLRVRAVGPNGAGPWSDPATIMVTWDAAPHGFYRF